MFRSWDNCHCYYTIYSHHFNPFLASLLFSLFSQPTILFIISTTLHNLFTLPFYSSRPIWYNILLSTTIKIPICCHIFFLTFNMSYNSLYFNKHRYNLPPQQHANIILGRLIKQHQFNINMSIMLLSQIGSKWLISIIPLTWHRNHYTITAGVLSSIKIGPNYLHDKMLCGYSRSLWRYTMVKHEIVHTRDDVNDENKLITIMTIIIKRIEDNRKALCILINNDHHFEQSTSTIYINNKLR